MNKLERHIEILLLNNDCVVVPDLGGFTAQHVDARYDDNDSQFLPPVRTLGFNTKLRHNDSLLAQSFVEAYDISYPEAVQCIEEEVAQIKQTIENEGSYELNGIGNLSVNKDGNYVFTPFESGILTPELYGLSCYEMRPLEKLRINTTDAHRHHVASNAEMNGLENDKGKTISIRVSVLRNAIAIAAAVAAFFLITTPLGNDSQQELTVSRADWMAISKLIPQATDDHKATSYGMEKKKVVEVKKETVAEKPAAPIVAKEEKTGGKWSIVLASGVQVAGAEYLINTLKKGNMPEGRIYEKKGMSRKVVYGHYDNEEQANKALAQLRGQSEHFKYSWVIEVKE